MSDQDTRTLSDTSGAAKKRKRKQREEHLKKTNRKITDYVGVPKKSSISLETKISLSHPPAVCSSSSEEENDSSSGPCTSRFHYSFFCS